MLLTLVLTLATANAATLDPDLSESLAVQQDIQLRELQAQQAATVAALTETRKELAKAKAGACHQDCPAVVHAPAPKPTAPAAAKKQTVTVTPIPAPPAPAFVPDLKIVELEGRMAALEATNTALLARIAAFPAPTPAYDDTALSGRVLALEQKPAPLIPLAYDDTDIKDRVTALEQTPPPAAPEATTSYVSDFHPGAYVFAGMVLEAPYPGHDDIVGGRLDVGARFLWETPMNLNLGIAIEGGPSTFIGWGVRGGPELTTDVGFGDLSLTAGVGYDCTDLGGLGCEAEHTGGFANVGWENGGILSFGVRAGVQVTWVTTSSVPEGFYDLNGTVGIGGYFGSLHPKGH